MTFSTDYLVVGAGLTGATIARQLHVFDVEIPGVGRDG
jgi:L-2-hydroxyglutarate oxidase LhgO